MSDEPITFAEQVDPDRLNIAWSHMIASLAHDLATPLVTLGMAGMNLAHIFPDLIEGYSLAVKNKLLTSALPEKRLNAAKNALSSAGIQSDVTYLLDFLKLLHLYTQQLLPTSPDRKLLNIRSCIEGIIKKYPFLDEKERALIEIDCKIDFNFNCAPIFIEELFSNLLSNALDQIKKTGQGKIRIWTEEEKNYYVFHFKDTAGNMNEHMLPRVFYHFFSKRNNKIIPGLGFCRLALLQQGGDIICSAISGQETNFVISFPKV